MKPEVRTLDLQASAIANEDYRGISLDPVWQGSRFPPQPPQYQADHRYLMKVSLVCTSRS
jgi:hypothetical protein